MNPGYKRALNKDQAKQTDGKRLCSDLLAAAQKEMIHGLGINIATIIRPVIAEEIERVLTRLASQQSLPLKQITELPARKFRLQFQTNPAPKIFTASNVEDKDGKPICVKLIEASTGQPVTTGPESAATLEVVPLLGDFDTSEEEDWDAQEFTNHAAKEREGRCPLLLGDLKVHLKSGSGTLGQMHFTDNSSVTRSKKFRLGIIAAQDNDGQLMPIREGKSLAFSVVDKRGKAYEKRLTPSPRDDVWRLQNIQRGGPYHNRLMQNGIQTVKDFLEARPERLKEVLGNMPEKALEKTIAHARRCEPGDKLYSYAVEQPPYQSFIFDPNYQAVGVVAQNEFVGLEMIDDNEKGRVDALFRSAYEHVTEWKVENIVTAQEPFLTAPPQVDVPAAAAAAANVVQLEAHDGGLPGADGIPGLLDPITGQGHVGAYWNQWFEEGSSSLHELALDAEQVSSLNLASWVEEVVREQQTADGDALQRISIHEPTQPSPLSGVGLPKGWLRIRTLIRCALFIRQALQQRSHHFSPSLDWRC